jgi:3-phosphoshikimate 1-carboxyvinyltransferase
VNVTITPKLLQGSIRPPASKSQAHRLLIGAALSQGTSVISQFGSSQDMEATLRCMEALGASYRYLDEGTIELSGLGGTPTKSPKVMDCGESGSTLRFLIPIALAVAGQGTFRGHGRLMERPQEPYFEIFRTQGISYHREGDTLTVQGQLTPGVYSLRGDVSSQFVTGLLYALPLLPGDSEIRLTTALESSGYVDMTLEALGHFGITVTPTETGYLVPGNQTYQAKDGAVEPDFSQSGFFYAMEGMGNPIAVTGLNPNSVQGDRVILPMMEELSGTGTVTLDVRECPDLVPPLAARAALRAGEVTHIVGAGRLRIKESDRLASVTAVLRAMGADIQEEPESLTIRGKAQLSGGVTVDSWNDHRIAMMAAAAATKCEHPITITGAECVRKSYPGFWADYRLLGGVITED